MLQVKASPNLQRKRRKKNQKRLRKNLIHYIEKQKKEKPNTPIAAKFTLKEKTKYEHFRRKTKEINFNKAKDKKKR